MECNSLEITPLDGSFGATVRGVRIASLAVAEWEQINDAWIEFGLLIFPGQHLTRIGQNTFAATFGDLEFTATALTNIDDDGTVLSDPDTDENKSLRGNEGWHHDSTYMPLQAKAAVFTAEIVPSTGGATGWADMRAAYAALDDETRASLDGLTAEHSRYYSMQRAGLMTKPGADGKYFGYGFHEKETPIRPLVKEHPDTGRPNLVIGQHASGVIGMDHDASTELLDRLNDAATSGPWVHHHQWEVGDAVLWDNRRLMHRATPYDLAEPRSMWHTRIAGDRPADLALNYR